MITAVTKPEFVRARVFDLWIGDWSKHEDNWKWAGYKDQERRSISSDSPRS